MPSNKKLLLIVIFFLIINSLSVYLVYYLNTSNQSKNKEPNQSFNMDDIVKYLSERNSLINVRTNHFLRKYTILDNGGSLTNKELSQVGEYLKKPIAGLEAEIVDPFVDYPDVISAYNQLSKISDEQIPFSCYPSVNMIYLGNASEDFVQYSIDLPDSVKNFFEGEYGGYDYVSDYVYCITPHTNLLTRNTNSDYDLRKDFFYLVIFNVENRNPNNSGPRFKTGYLIVFNGYIYSSTYSSSAASGLIKPLMVSKSGDVYYINQAGGGGWGSISLYTFNIKGTSPIRQLFDCTGGIEGGGSESRYGGNCFIYDSEKTLRVNNEKLIIK